MRVLHINCNYIGTTLHQLMVDALTKAGIENEVFVPTYDRNISAIKPNDNVYVSECFNKWDRIAFDYKQSKIIKAIEEHYDVASFDLIHAYTLFTDGNAARILSEKYGVPFVVAVRNTDVNDFFKKMLHLRSRGIKTMLAAKKVFFLSPAYRTEVFGKYVPEKRRDILFGKTEILPNGIDDFWFEHLYQERNSEEIERRIQNKQIRLIYAGGIDRNKNITTTCEAIDLLKKDGWTVDFTVVGKVKNQEVFDSIKDKVNYLPARPKEALIAAYRKADIFVMPSHHETFGLVYAEAMSQGLPVIYTKEQGFDGQFKDGEVGFSVDSASPDDLAQRIQDICANYSEFSVRCLDRVTAFRWSDIVEKYCFMYDAILNEGK